MNAATLRLAWLGAALALQGAAQGQIRTDASLGQAGRSLGGPAYEIPQSLGKLVGSNLFHSFQTFNLAPDESATFRSSVPGLANVISRVTGGASSIEGRIVLDAGGATPAFFFINPAGITFGAGAALDVPGALHLSSANFLRFGDGAVMQADLKAASSFSSAAPEAFGFLGSTRATISVRDGAVLVTRALQPLSLVAGDISVDASLVGAAGADLRLAAVGQAAQTLGLRAPLPPLAGEVSVSNGALLEVISRGGHDGGRLEVGAGNIRIDNSSVMSLAPDSASGNGGAIELRAAATLALSSGASVHAGTEGVGNGGAITLSARDMRIDGGSDVTSEVDAGASGGAITLHGTATLLLSNAKVGSYDFGAGAAGAVSLDGGAITLDAHAQVYSAALGGGPVGAIALDTPGRFSASGGASIASLSGAPESGTSVHLRAAEIAISGGASLYAVGSGVGSRAAALDIAASGAVVVSDGASINSFGTDGGSGGPLRVAARELTVDGGASQLITTISSGSADGSGAAGDIALAASASMAVINNGFVSSGTYSSADSGAISLSAHDLRLDGGQVFNGALGGSGNGGAIDIQVAGALTLAHGSSIGSGSETGAHSGSIHIAAGSVALGGASYIDTRAATETAGAAGNIDLVAQGALTLGGASFIDSSSASNSNAGNISLTAASIALDQASLVSSFALTPGLRGNAGNIALIASGQIVMGQDAGLVNSTFSLGDAGTIGLRAASLHMDGATIHSQTLSELGGRAGNIDLRVGADLSIARGELSSTTFGSGSAGSITLRAARIDLSGANTSVTAEAASGSSGQTGTIDMAASSSLRISDGAVVLIQNGATLSPAAAAAVQPSRIVLAAPLIELDHALVSAASGGNVAASAVRIDAGEQLRLGTSSVATVANLGNGGAITIAGGRLMVLGDSLLTTSVLGRSGNGGDITVGAAALLLNTGFIQANTAALHASGGLVNVKVGLLVASGSSLFVGGAQALQARAGVFGLNVIQAAAPDGVSGTIAITSPALDLSASLHGLNAQLIDTGGLGRNPCLRGSTSTLSVSGRGGLAPSARARLGAPAPALGAGAAQLASGPVVGCR
ncbi:MAG: filamentous hemagglutinin N-terminal domain-containing protein [Pseudomonadota bacterium]